MILIPQRIFVMVLLSTLTMNICYMLSTKYFHIKMFGGESDLASGFEANLGQCDQKEESLGGLIHKRENSQGSLN